MQRDLDWDNDRIGRITGSRFKDVVAFGKNGKPLKARSDYIGELVTELLTGQANSPHAPSMTWGVDVEPAAKAAYEAKYGVILEEPDFVIHPDIPYIGVSPDGLVNKDGGTEFKCPYNSKVHIDTVINGMPDEHIPQVQGNIWVNDRKWWDFCSFDPRMPKHLRLYVQRVYRDDDYIKDLRSKCQSLWDEVQEIIQRLKVAA